MTSTQSFRVANTFGQDGAWYRLILQSRDSSRFMVWYYEPIGCNVGDEAIVEFDYLGNWEKISIPKTGRWAKIHQATKVN